MQIISARRLGALTAGLAGAALTVGVLALPATADTTPTTTLADTWLKGELSGGLIPSQYGGSDVGLSIDAAFTALAAGDTTTATTIRDAVAANVNGYITGEAFGDTGSTYAGATAKTLVLAERTGGNPRSFGGVDLVARLEAVTLPSGRLQDTSMFGDYANTLGQSFAVEGLAVAGSTEAAAARSFLLQQQCTGGFFRGSFAAATAADQSCTSVTAPTASIDATGLAVSALLANGAPTSAPVTAAVTYLTGTAQQLDGSFSANGTPTGANANSTGLAGTALGEACAVDGANKAATAIRGLQVPSTSTRTADRGAIAVNLQDYTTAQATGVPTAAADRDRYRRATAQAAPALVFDSGALPTVSVSGPTGSVPAGSSQVLVIGGVSRGEVVCLTGPSGTARYLGTGSAITVPVTAPASGSATYSATTGPGAATATVTAGTTSTSTPTTTPTTTPTGTPTSVPTVSSTPTTTGTPTSTPTATPTAKPAVFDAKPVSKTFRPGAKVKVKLTGYATGSKVVVRLSGKVVKKTTASGTIGKVTFTVPAGTPAGKTAVKVKVGSDADTFAINVKG